MPKKIKTVDGYLLINVDEYRWRWWINHKPHQFIMRLTRLNHQNLLDYKHLCFVISLSWKAFTNIQQIPWSSCITQRYLYTSPLHGVPRLMPIPSSVQIWRFAFSHGFLCWTMRSCCQKLIALEVIAFILVFFDWWWHDMVMTSGC